jgi:LysM repeat protein
MVLFNIYITFVELAMKNILLIHYRVHLILISLSFGALHAQNQITDAAFIKVDPKLGKVIYHRVTDHQTLYAISRGYGVSEQSILNINPVLQKDATQLPEVLKIPVSTDQIMHRLPLFKNKYEFLPVYYQVQKKDNLFRISRVYFDIPTNLLSNRNNLKDENLKEGQTLHIGWLKQTYEPLMVHEGKILDSVEREKEDGAIIKDDLASRFQKESEGTSLVNKNEVAFWKSTETTKGLFVMHRYAAQQSIIEIKNPMSDATAYAKVIGSIPEHLYPKEVDMVISRDVAQILGAVDPRFFVRSRYKSSMVSVSR